MTFYDPIRLVTDEQLRQSRRDEQEQQTSFRRRIEPKLKLLDARMAQYINADKDHDAVCHALVRAMGKAQTEAQESALQFAATAFDHAIELFDQGKGNFSQRHLVHRLRHDRQRAAEVFGEVLQEPNVANFLKHHQRNRGDKPLTPQGHLMLSRYIAGYFEQRYSAQDYLKVDLYNSRGASR